jgi:hypothetical protein
LLTLSSIMFEVIHASAREMARVRGEVYSGWRKGKSGL